MPMIPPGPYEIILEPSSSSSTLSYISFHVTNKELLSCMNSLSIAINCVEYVGDKKYIFPPPAFLLISIIG